ncbi:MAG: ATP-dependent RecD-like DNA helicase [Clostridiales bacterium]|nr:ATP-dependent RecD-like DNA helicase [Clostridiales bacterium]
MLLQGVIEEIIFRNDDNGYTVAVLSYQNDGVEEYATIVGTLSTPHVGQSLKLEGKYTNSKYGEQFSFDSAEVVYPNTLSGIKKYLSSGLIKGVGPVTASLIVDCFKHDTLGIIEYAPEKLASIKGISKKKAISISEAFNEIKKMQNSVMALQSYNISINLAIKIYNQYGDNTIEYVKNNPYRLVEDIDGVGFLTADNIAKSVGIASNSLFRIRAGIIHILNDSCEKTGNTYLYKQDLIKQTGALLELNPDVHKDKIYEAFENMGYDKLLTMFRAKDGNEIVMLTKLYFVESSVAQKLALLNTTSKTTDKKLDGAIKLFEQINKILFDDQQRQAIQNSIQSGVSVITGGPGTGKTTIINCILKILEQEGNKVLLLAPTGRASKRLSESTGKEAKTIHRGLEVNFKNDGKTFLYNEQNPLNVNAVIVDEVSMVDVFLMNHLLKALPKDCKLILVGDKDQLPSVGAGNVLADILNSGIIKVSYLTKIFRQDEKSLIVSNAHLINNGQMPIIDNSSKDFFFESKDDAYEIKETIITLATKRLPNFAKTKAEKIQVLAPLKSGASGIQSLNESLQDKINPPQRGKNEIVIGHTIFREGDKIMQTINNYNLLWTKKLGLFTEEGSGVFNGDIGYITKIYPGTNETDVVFEDGRECRYQRTDLPELSLAYAITIHKSQGSEFDCVVIPVISGAPMILTRNLIYTAITRAKKLVVLVGNKTNLKRMINNNYTIQRLTMLKDFLLESNQKLKLLYE